MWLPASPWDPSDLAWPCEAVSWAWVDCYARWISMDVGSILPGVPRLRQASMSCTLNIQSEPQLFSTSSHMYCVRCGAAMIWTRVSCHLHPTSDQTSHISQKVLCRVQCNFFPSYQTDPVMEPGAASRLCAQDACSGAGLKAYVRDSNPTYVIL